MKKAILLLFCLLACFYGNAQKTFILPEDSYFLFTLKNKYYILSKKSIYETVDGIYWTEKNHDIPISSVDFTDLQFDQASTYLLVRSGGSTYSFDGNVFTPITNLGELRNQYNSYAFLYNDIPHLFAGYGLFTLKNIITYLNPISKTWELMPDYSHEKPQERASPLGQIKQQNLYIGMGYTEQFNANGEKQTIVLKDFWRFDLESKIWEKVGQCTQEASTIFPQTTIEESLVIKNFKNQSVLVNDNKIYLFDIEKNVLTFFPKSQLPHFRPNYQHFTYNPSSDCFFYLSKDFNNSFIPIIVPADKLLGKLAVAKQLYEPIHSFKKYINWLILLIILGVLIGTIKIYFQRRKKKSTIFELIMKELNRINTILSPEEILVFNKILNQYPNKITYSELMDTFDPKLTHDTLKKKVKVTIEEIDKKIQDTIENENSIFEIIKSSDDKRMKKIGIKKN